MTGISQAGLDEAEFREKLHLATVKKLRALLDKAEVFRVNEDVTVEARGNGAWAVCYFARSVVNADLEREFEPMPSGRDEAFIARTRFSLEKAFEVAEAYIKKKEQDHGT